MKKMILSVMCLSVILCCMTGCKSVELGMTEMKSQSEYSADPWNPNDYSKGRTLEIEWVTGGGKGAQADNSSGAVK